MCEANIQVSGDYHEGGFPAYKSISELKDLNGKPAQTLENNIQSRAEMNYIKGLKQHHSRVSPVSLQVHAKAYAVGDGCQTWSFLILDAF